MPKKIRVKEYSRKAHSRRLSNGSVIHVKRSIVPSHLTIDKGSPGHGKQVLPKPGNKLHLRKYGYSVANTVAKRRRSLSKAGREEGELAVIRRLNLLRNYQATPDVKEKMSKDIKWLSKKRNSKSA